MNKKCSKCDNSKPSSDFSPNPKAFDGLRNQCKECVAKYAVSRAMAIKKENKDKDPYAVGGSKKCSKCTITHPLICFAKCGSRRDGLQSVCKNCHKAFLKKWYQKNKTKVAENSADWVARNPERNREYKRKWTKDRYTNNPLVRLKDNLSTQIRFSMRSAGSRKSKRTLEYLGCSISDFANHMGKQFLEGMSWDNMGEWHIDHILPTSSAKSVDDLIALLHFTNLRPLWAEDNIRKSNKILFLI